MGAYDVFLPILPKNLTRSGYPSIQDESHWTMEFLFKSKMAKTGPSNVPTYHPQVQLPVFALFVVSTLMWLPSLLSRTSSTPAT